MASREAVLEIKAVLGGDMVSFEDAEMITDLAIKGVTDAFSAMDRVSKLQLPDLMLQTVIIMTKLMHEALTKDIENFKKALTETKL